jgi:hypothetical protein
MPAGLPAPWGALARGTKNRADAINAVGPVTVSKLTRHYGLAVSIRP